MGRMKCPECARKITSKNTPTWRLLANSTPLVQNYHTVTVNAKKHQERGPLLALTPKTADNLHITRLKCRMNSDSLLCMKFHGISINYPVFLQWYGIDMGHYGTTLLGGIAIQPTCMEHLQGGVCNVATSGPGCYICRWVLKLRSEDRIGWNSLDRFSECPVAASCSRGYS